MQLLQVTDKQGEKDFIRVNVEINRSVEGYIRPLDKDVIHVFDKKANKAFRHGEVSRWLLKSEDGRLLGRIAAFINKKYRNKGDEMPVGGIGFFDCINDQNAADMLFNVAKHWLMQHGMEAMDGPINFGERDRWWGLIVRGFDAPIYCMNFNAPYYRTLFESYGFQPFYNQFCFAMKVNEKLLPKFYERHERIAADPQFRAEHIRKNQLEKYALDFATIYNEAWAGHGGMKSVSKDVVLKTFQQMKPIMDEQLIWYAYHNDRPIAMWVNLPDLNQWFKHLDGRFDWLGKLKFLWIKTTKPCKKFTGLVFGVVPDYQAMGIDAFMIVEGAKLIQHKLPYLDYEMQWIGDFNPKMLNIAESLGTYQSRHLITYRYQFDGTKEFKRHPKFN